MVWLRIDADPQIEHVERLTEEAFGSRPVSAKKLGEGAYGIVYDVQLPHTPDRVVVKWQKRIGQGMREARQLKELRKHALVRVPEVLYYHPGSADVPFEAIVMEHIPGTPASELPAPPAEIAPRFASDAIDVLMHWHGVRQGKGYGPLDGPFRTNWADYYRQRIYAYWSEIQSICPRENHLPAEMLQLAGRSLDAAEAILGPRDNEAVLLHSDYWLANILIDSKTYRITGVIDPLDAEWGDRELDLILLNVYWGRELDLLGEYCRRVPSDEQFELRQVFYRFWYEIQSYARIRWHEDGLNRSLTQRLDMLMSRYL